MTYTTDNIKPATPGIKVEEKSQVDMDWDLVPLFIRNQKCWGVYEAFGNKRPTSVLTRSSIGWNKPSNWVNFEKAFAFCEANDEYLPGLFFTLENRVVGIDLDSCRDPLTGFIESWAQSIVDACGTYAEVSISGTGLKLLGLSDNWQRNKIVGMVNGVNSYGTHAPQFDLRFGSSFFGLTGQAVQEGCAEIGELILPLADRLAKHAQRRRQPALSSRLNARRRSRPAKTKQSKYQTLIRHFNDHVDISSVVCAYGWTDLGGGNYRRPGKIDSGASASTKISDDGTERISFWSSDSDPFITSEPGAKATTYTAFDCVCLLRFGGNFRAAIESLQRSQKQRMQANGGKS